MEWNLEKDNNKKKKHQKTQWFQMSVLQMQVCSKRNNIRQYLHKESTSKKKWNSSNAVHKGSVVFHYY